MTVEIKTFFILFLSFGAIQATKSSCHIDDTGSGCKQSRSSSWFDGMIQKRAILEAEKDCSKIAGAVPMSRLHSASKASPFLWGMTADADICTRGN